MIRELARLVFGQVRVPRGRLIKEPDPSPAGSPVIGHSKSVSAASPCAHLWTPSTEPLDAGSTAQEQTLALVVLFTHLAQRRVQAKRQPGGCP